MSAVTLGAGTTLQTLLAAETALRGSGQASLVTTGAEPWDAELTRAARRFTLGFEAAVTGIAPVQAIPGTAAQWLIWNTASPGGRSLVIDQLGVVLVSGTAGAGIVLLAGLVGVGSQPTTLPTASDAHVIIAPCNSGNASPTSKSVAVCASAQTLAASPKNGLFPIAFTPATNNTAILSVACMNPEVKGKIIVPPQNGLALYTASPAGTSPLFVPVGSWTELELSLA